MIDTTSEVVSQPRAEALQDDKAAASEFVNSEPIREEQVQNAVKFLSHPKVRGSPVIYRRSFLERKGLTKEEIDAAFRLVPDPPSASSTAQPVVTNQDGQLKASSSIQTQNHIQNSQLAAATPAGAVSKAGTFSRFHWSHGLLAVGFLSLSGVATVLLVKNSVVPRLKSWIRKVVLDEDNEDIAKKSNSGPSLVEEAAAAAKTAAAAAADVARTSQEILGSKAEDRRVYEELMKLLEVQVREVKSLGNAIERLEGTNGVGGRTSFLEQDHRVSVTNPRQLYANGRVETDSNSVRSISPPAAVEHTSAPHPKSYMEIMAMVQRGETPPNVREINDKPPNPNQPLPNPSLVPRPKPWEIGQAQSGAGSIFPSQNSTGGFINSGSQDFGYNSQLNGESSVPWLHRRNIRISEIESEEEQQRIQTSGMMAGNNDRPIQRSWVPPQPPPVAMPEAAAAIRQPKKLPVRKELTDKQLLAQSSNAADELQRITRISESGGVQEENVVGPGLNSGEMQEEIPSLDA